ncbi:YcxB family protein [Kitasatospora sp. NPDC096077]|uniref:YcxB family protein n=1 Tax=Kitasatospora sp. NPDC096077 TaxID=3155544 RepID=UPI00332FC144
MEQDRTELAYTPTGEDFREAFAAQARHTTVGRAVRIAWWAAAGFAVLGCATDLADGRVEAASALPAVVLVTLAALAPRLQVRSAQRRVARRGPRTVLVDGTGVSVVDGRGTVALPWARVPRLLETENLFLVLNRSGSCLMVLPKRAAADPDALRALLARHTTAVRPPAHPGTDGETVR